MDVVVHPGTSPKGAVKSIMPMPRSVLQGSDQTWSPSEVVLVFWLAWKVDTKGNCEGGVCRKMGDWWMRWFGDVSCPGGDEYGRWLKGEKVTCWLMGIWNMCAALSNPSPERNNFEPWQKSGHPAIWIPVLEVPPTARRFTRLRRSWCGKTQSQQRHP